MAEDLNITPGLSSLLGALFFLGYFFFQVPGAIYAQRNRVKKLIFVSLILWGGLATLTGVVSNAYMLIKEEDLPKSVLDFADPEWQGKVGPTAQ